jgi:very-short-patch-repair endonuclease
MRGPDRRTVHVERRLRGQQTDAERKLWFAVRDRRLSGFKFVRKKQSGRSLSILSAGRKVSSSNSMAASMPRM